MLAPYLRDHGTYYTAIETGADSASFTAACVAPGPFKTNINDGRFFNGDNEAREAATVPLGRIAQPDEIKGLALFLSSAAAGYVTGAVIPIDGGKTAGG
ncbi:SDR family oxidoreductase [Rhodopseudomonas sp.]|uniref:SDR family oxidoreductase n=1 Tax=Rhodopseudomonas sp. TaxID=1078 RepID=UPI003B3B6646